MSIMRSVLLAGAESVWLREHADAGPVRAPLRLAVHARASRWTRRSTRAGGSRRSAAPARSSRTSARTSRRLAEADQVTEHYLELLDRIQAAGARRAGVGQADAARPRPRRRCLRGKPADPRRARRGARQHVLDRHGEQQVRRSDAGAVPPRPPAFAAGRPVPAGVPAPHRGGSRVAACRSRPLSASSRAPTGAAGDRVPQEGGRGRELLPAGRSNAPARRATRHLARRRHARRAGSSSGCGPSSRSTTFPRPPTSSRCCTASSGPLQARLVREGAPLRVLISYGEFWFPWYMRRLAERPANVLFVAKSMFGG